MKSLRRFLSLGLVLTALALPTTTQAFAAEDAEASLSVEELLRTEAGQLYITRQFDKALEGFKALSSEYPENTIIKRYIGSTLFHLKRDDESILAFQEVIKSHPRDLPSRQFLSRIYLRQGELDSAEKELKFIIEHDASGSFTESAERHLATIDRLKKTEEGVHQSEGRNIPPKDFLKTHAAKHFINARYQEAYEELLKLEVEYPEDILIKRYKGLALSKLGRHEEADEAYRAGLGIDGNNIPIHYFRGQTLARQEKYREAASEFHFVMKNDPGNAYKDWAERDLDASLRIVNLLKKKPKIKKKWSFNASQQTEYHNNATSESRFFESVNEEHAFKFSQNFGGDYQIFKNGPWTGKLTYAHSNARYTDGIESINFNYNNAGAKFTHVQMLNSRPFITQIAQNNAHTIVNHKFYNMKWEASLLLVYSFADWHRIIVQEKVSAVNYKSKGSFDKHTSKKGWGYSSSIMNNFYFDEDKTRYIKTGVDWGVDDTEGSNFAERWHALTLGYSYPIEDFGHIPLVGHLFRRLLDYKWVSGWDNDLTFKYKEGEYTDYIGTSRALERIDKDYMVKTRSSRLIDDNWTLSLNYDYTNVISTDNTYTYIDHAGGFKFLYRY